MVEKSHSADWDTGWWPSMPAPLRGLGDKIAHFFAPSADAAQTGAYYEINVELPGVSTADIDVSIHDGTLTIKGEKRLETETKGRTYFFSEREFGAFMRSFRLPADVNDARVVAEFKDGILTLRVPKAGASPKQARRIEIRTN